MKRKIILVILLICVYGCLGCNETQSAIDSEFGIIGDNQTDITTDGTTEAQENPDINTMGNQTETSTEKLTETPTEKPTEMPTEAPTQKPTEAPTQKPTEAPTQKPTEAPTQKPTEAPTQKPTEVQTQKPTEAPTQKSTEAPTQKPTEAQTQKPTEAPTQKPTETPTEAPTESVFSDVRIYRESTEVSDEIINTDVYITSNAVVQFNNVTVNGNIYCYGKLSMKGCVAQGIYAYKYGSMFSCGAFDGVHGHVTGGGTVDRMYIMDDALDYAFDKWGKQ